MFYAGRFAREVLPCEIFIIRTTVRVISKQNGKCTDAKAKVVNAAVLFVKLSKATERLIIVRVASVNDD